MIIYIAGYGRSGSTVLDIVLSNTDNVVTVGEINNVFNERKEVTNAYFAKILEKAIFENGLSDIEIKKIQKADKIPSRFDPNYSKFWSTFYNEVKTENGQYIVDSSKTTWHTLFRPYNLSKSGFEVKIIFLKASYIKVWASAIKGSNKSLQKKQENQKKHYLFAIKSVCSKFFIDLFTELFYSNKKYKLLKISYSDFINDTLKTINKISNHFKIDFIDLEEKIEKNEFMVKGGYLGNRLRKENSVIKIKKDV